MLRWNSVFIGVLVGLCWVGFGVVCWVGASLKTTIHNFFYSTGAYFVPSDDKRKDICTQPTLSDEHIV